MWRVREGCPCGNDPMHIAAQIAAKGVVIYMVGCEPSIIPYKDWFMAVAHITGGQYVPLASAQLLTSVGNIVFQAAKVRAFKL
jgi:hypothetical protein